MEKLKVWYVSMLEENKARTIILTILAVAVVLSVVGSVVGV